MGYLLPTSPRTYTDGWLLDMLNEHYLKQLEIFIASQLRKYVNIGTFKMRDLRQLKIFRVWEEIYYLFEILSLFFSFVWKLPLTWFTTS